MTAWNSLTIVKKHHSSQADRRGRPLEETVLSVCTRTFPDAVKVAASIATLPVTRQETAWYTSIGNDHQFTAEFCECIRVLTIALAYWMIYVDAPTIRSLLKTLSLFSLTEWFTCRLKWCIMWIQPWKVVVAFIGLFCGVGSLSPGNNLGYPHFLYVKVFGWYFQAPNISVRFCQ